MFLILLSSMFLSLRWFRWALVQCVLILARKSLVRQVWPVLAGVRAIMAEVPCRTVPSIFMPCGAAAMIRRGRSFSCSVNRSTL